jgi:hypothetical protein
LNGCVTRVVIQLKEAFKETRRAVTSEMEGALRSGLFDSYFIEDERKEMVPYAFSVHKGRVELEVKRETNLYSVTLSPSFELDGELNLHYCTILDKGLQESKIPPSLLGQRKRSLLSDEEKPLLKKSKSVTNTK